MPCPHHGLTPSLLLSSTPASTLVHSGPWLLLACHSCQQPGSPVLCPHSLLHPAARGAFLKGKSNHLISWLTIQGPIDTLQHSYLHDLLNPAPEVRQALTSPLLNFSCVPHSLHIYHISNTRNYSNTPNRSNRFSPQYLFLWLALPGSSVVPHVHLVDPQSLAIRLNFSLRTSLLIGFTAAFLCLNSSQLCTGRCYNPVTLHCTWTNLSFYFCPGEQDFWKQKQFLICCGGHSSWHSVMDVTDNICFSVKEGSKMSMNTSIFRILVLLREVISIIQV